MHPHVKKYTHPPSHERLSNSFTIPAGNAPDVDVAVLCIFALLSVSSLDFC